MRKTTHHPKINTSKLDKLFEIEKREFNLPMFVSDIVLYMLFDVLSWSFFNAPIKNAYKDVPKLGELFESINIDYVAHLPLVEASLYLYVKLSKEYDMRSIEKGEVVKIKEGDNKALGKDDFTISELYDTYKKGKADISKDLLNFNDLLISTNIKAVVNIQSFGEITKAARLFDLALPDLHYKLGTKTLLVNHNVENTGHDDKLLYVLQDSTYSMKKFIDKLLNVKAFIIDAAIKNDYKVVWLYVSNGERERDVYDKDNYTIGEDIIYTGINVNMTSLLLKEEFNHKKVVIITDGTDSFDFKFNTSTSDISCISFIDNINIRNKINMHGRYFTT